MSARLERLVKHPALWWVWGVEATLPITLAISAFSFALAFYLLIAGLPASENLAKYRVEIAASVALFPPLIAGLALSVPGIARIASVYRSEALQLVHGNRSMLVAFYQMLTLPLVPLVLLTLALKSLVPLLLGIAMLGVFLLSYWYVRFGDGVRNERRNLLNGAASAAPTLMLIATGKLLELQPNALTISVACALFFPAVLMRHRQLANPVRHQSSRKRDQVLRRIFAQFNESDLLLRAAVLIGMTLIYTRFTKSGSMMLFIAVLAHTIGHPNALRDRLQRHWLNGRSRIELVGEAFKETLREQGVLILLTAILLVAISALGFLPWLWLWAMLISMIVGAVPLTTWQLTIVARMHPQEMIETRSMWRTNLLRTMPMVAIFPWQLATMVFFDLFQDNLPMFALCCVVLAIVMTVPGIPVLRRVFERIEL